jgi:heme oxygenase (mycobilin-producing)
MAIIYIRIKEELVMNFYTTSGTADFLQKLIDKHPNEQLILLSGTDKTVVLHETEGKSIFSLPKKYEVAATHGPIEQLGYYVLHHFSADGGNRDVLLQQFKTALDTFKTDLSLRAFRLLKPKKGSEQIVFLTHWSGPHSYEAWLASDSYKNQFEQLLKIEASAVQKIFDGGNYVATYVAPPKED